jgi:hypothetical protein
MTVDTVDDLHGAEDMIGVAHAYLEMAARDVHLFHARGSFAECRKEACERLRAALADVGGYCRGSCVQDDDGTWACGEDCGCPGHHGPGHGGDE